ncbi:hypothetical protein CPB84DRAFT_1749902 [Gymnopilus junonius]|uniref:Uncharacterized protein n=1 Tax=Gymnopilus junonius TaxID=109634 RepID=A0A9P5NHL9_GYMJU|nr:hypothetical protein CPB84DRAFT_1749902 [Gymnopilus junonius]
MSMFRNIFGHRPANDDVELQAVPEENRISNQFALPQSMDLHSDSPRRLFLTSHLRLHLPHHALLNATPLILLRLTLLGSDFTFTTPEHPHPSEDHDMEDTRMGVSLDQQASSSLSGAVSAGFRFSSVDISPTKRKHFEGGKSKDGGYPRKVSVAEARADKAEKEEARLREKVRDAEDQAEDRSKVDEVLEKASLADKRADNAEAELTRFKARLSAAPTICPTDSIEVTMEAPETDTAGSENQRRVRWDDKLTGNTSLEVRKAVEDTAMDSDDDVDLHLAIRSDDEEDLEIDERSKGKQRETIISTSTVTLPRMIVDDEAGNNGGTKNFGRLLAGRSDVGIKLLNKQSEGCLEYGPSNCKSGNGVPASGSDGEDEESEVEQPTSNSQSKEQNRSNNQRRTTSESASEDEDEDDHLMRDLDRKYAQYPRKKKSFHAHKKTDQHFYEHAEGQGQSSPLSLQQRRNLKSPIDTQGYAQEAAEISQESRGGGKGKTIVEKEWSQRQTLDRPRIICSSMMRNHNGSTNQVWRQLLGMIDKLGMAGMSSDESELDENGNPVYFMRKRHWRPRRITEQLVLIDKCRNTTTGTGDIAPGNPAR